MDLTGKNVAELTAALDQIDAQRLALKEQARAIQEARQRLLHEENLDIWCVTEEQWQAAKAASRCTPPAEIAGAEAARLRAKARRLTDAAERSDRHGHPANAARCRKEAVELTICADKAEQLAKRAPTVPESTPIPLHVALNNARRRNLKELRNAQSTKVNPASVGAAAK